MSDRGDPTKITFEMYYVRDFDDNRMRCRVERKSGIKRSHGGIGSRHFSEIPDDFFWRFLRGLFEEAQ